MQDLEPGWKEKYSERTKSDTEQYGDLVNEFFYIEDEHEIFVYDEDSGEIWEAKEFFYNHCPEEFEITKEGEPYLHE